MTELEVNRKMFYLIAEAIEEKPEMHEQNSWFDWNYIDGAKTEFVAGREVSCGTTQCIAGWAIALDGQLNGFGSHNVIMNDDTTAQIGDNEFFIDRGKEILGLSLDDAYKLFMTTTTKEYDWPNVLRDIGDGKSVSQALEDHWNHQMSDEDYDY
jgi:hypothetical protein